MWAIFKVYPYPLSSISFNETPDAANALWSIWNQLQENASIVSDSAQFLTTPNIWIVSFKEKHAGQIIIR